MALPAAVERKFRMPLIGVPMFIVSVPDLVMKIADEYEQARRRLPAT